jgi:tripartite-type tricarboxylate transporter receptor subunit TctC
LWFSAWGPILGQTVIIENRGGAGGALGTKSVAAAEPDGYFPLLVNASALVVGPAVYRFRDYDTIRQFTPVAKVTEGYEVLVVALGTLLLQQSFLDFN